MSTEIYYFSGTGNSLHVSKELQNRLPKSSLLPIISLLKKEKIKVNAEKVGIVFPIHALTFPWVVKDFLQKIDLESDSYLFAIATRECFATVFSKIDKLLANQNRSLDAYLSFEMPTNYVLMFNTYSQEKIDNAESKMLEKLDSFVQVVNNRETFRPKDNPMYFGLSHVVYPLLTYWFQKRRFPKMERSFYVDNNCSGCGICEQVCLSNKIKIVDKKPVWQENVKCTYCLACLHYCPDCAIQIMGRNTVNRGRYHHPDVLATDIINQK
ncbi:MAG: EFR1 family ferrodoxin [Candidatus Bathyarchaeota archaeon]|nr:EFR1 family ferrodoxin [Candidatus Bathyarchaeum tardum]WGM89381.1 MAG: EFR1 family ferrodoxin [Candidatus Bathyarchaeum tardum]